MRPIATEARDFDGQTIGRLTYRDVDGSEYHVWRITERREPTITKSFDKAVGAVVERIQHHPVRVAWEAGEAPSARWQRIDARLFGAQQIDPREPSEIHDEVDRAMRAGFEAIAARLAASVRLEPRTDQYLADALGPVSKARGMLKLAVPDVELRELLRRHQSCDWGINGRLADVVLDDDKRWCPPRFGIAVENAAAVESGSGIVLSRYEYMADAPGQHDGKRLEHIECLTWLSPAGNRTAVWSLRHDR